MCSKVRFKLQAPPSRAADPSLAPALQNAAQELQKHKVEDVLAKKLEHRPEVGDLVQHNILKGAIVSICMHADDIGVDPSMAPGLQAAAQELLKHKVEDQLQQALGQRPGKQDLIDANIMKRARIVSIYS
jgi:hypothetical protein